MTVRFGCRVNASREGEHLGVGKDGAHGINVVSLERAQTTRLPGMAGLSGKNPAWAIRPPCTTTATTAIVSDPARRRSIASVHGAYSHAVLMHHQGSVNSDIQGAGAASVMDQPIEVEAQRAWHTWCHAF